MKKIKKIFLIFSLVLLVLFSLIYISLWIKSKTFQCSGNGWNREDWNCSRQVRATEGYTIEYLPLILRCKVQGGQIDQVYGWSDSFFCSLPAKDTGEECLNSSECESRCITDLKSVQNYCNFEDDTTYLCGEKFYGHCSSGLSYNNSEVYELNNKTARKYESILDDWEIIY